ncbi:MAG: transposase [Nitrospiraceae bacterium]|nr:transposase [Nitrospira sp.]MCB9775296.1 transposase [Nitrospiraceae bacterium]
MAEWSHERFNGAFRRECLDAESFRHLTEAQVVIEAWRHRYNQERPHSTLGYQTPARVYGKAARQGSGSEVSSGAVLKISTPIFDHHATIGTRPDSEAGKKSTIRGSSDQDTITRKT